MARRCAALVTLLLALLAGDAQAAGRGLLASDAAKGASSAAAAKRADQYGGPGWGGAAGPYGGGGPYGFNSFGGGGNGWGGGGGGNPYGMNARQWNRQQRQQNKAARQYERQMRRYDRDLLRGVIPRNYPRAPAAPAPFNPAAQRWARQNLEASSDARAAARSMVAGSPEIVAEGLVDAAARGGGHNARLSDAMAYGAAMDRGATARVLARGANYALLRGQTGAFADAAADAFVASRRYGSIKPFGLAMADAVAQGGDYGAVSFGEAIARAVAEGGDGQAAVAEATAEVFCSGQDSYATAWSTAFAVALNQDQNGCLVLSKARALATASCGGGAFNSFADSDATSSVLGFCGLFPPGMGPNFNFNSGDGGGNSWSGKKK